MINEIRAFKFLSGEIVIAQVLSHDASTDTYCVQNPITLGMAQDRAGNTQLSAQPWPQFISDSEKTLEVSGESLIVKPYPIVEQLRDMYSAQFGGIVLPTKSLII
jgi:hypothetical protein